MLAEGRTPTLGGVLRPPGLSGFLRGRATFPRSQDPNSVRSLPCHSGLGVLSLITSLLGGDGSVLLAGALRRGRDQSVTVPSTPGSLAGV